MKLTKKLETLLFMACKQSGSYDPDKALTYIEEQLTISEYHTATMEIAVMEWDDRILNMT